MTRARRPRRRVQGADLARLEATVCHLAARVSMSKNPEVIREIANQVAKALRTRRSVVRRALSGCAVSTHAVSRILQGVSDVQTSKREA